MDEIFKDIDDYYKASDIIQMIKDMEQTAETNYRANIRSDGHAKSGKAMAVLSACQHREAAKEVLRMIAREVDNW